MATNRPYDLDEAMHRRIMIAIEFRQPDHILRKAIWESHMPEQMKLAEDVDLVSKLLRRSSLSSLLFQNELALRFELTGGFIKNAILSALSIAVSREGDSPTVSQKDLLQGANLQLRGILRMKDFHHRVVPSKGLDKIIVTEKLNKSLMEIVQYEKARCVGVAQCATVCDCVCVGQCCLVNGALAPLSNKASHVCSTVLLVLASHWQLRPLDMKLENH